MMTSIALVVLIMLSASPVLAQPPCASLAQQQVLASAGGPEEQAFLEAPALAGDGLGRLWLTWLKRLPDYTEQLCFSRYDDTWSEPLPFASGRFEAPQLACAPGGTPMAVWVSLEGDSFRLRASRWTGEGFSRPSLVPSAGGKAANPALIAGADGDFWLAFEDYKQARFRVFLTHFEAGKWSKPVLLSDAGRNAYTPSLALDGNGQQLWVAWSAVMEEGAYALHGRSLDLATDAVGPRLVLVAGGQMGKRPDISLYPSLSTDPAGGIWLAWEGDSPGSLRQTRVSGLGDHWGGRRINVVHFEAGRLSEPRPRMRPAGSPVLSGLNDHMPALLSDPAGRLWVFSRLSVQKPQPPWSVRCAVLGAGGWSQAADLLQEQPLGRLAHPAVAFTSPGELWVAWTSDNLPNNRTARQLTELHVARCEASVTPAASPPLRTLVQSVPEAPVTLASAPSRATLEVSGERYTLLSGNLHEHTLFSRCWVDGSDGWLQDDYRYGHDEEGYDFVGLTDHGYDMGPAEWREVVRTADFYEIGRAHV